MSSTVNNVEPAEAVKGRPLQEIERDVARVVEELEALTSARDELPAQVEAATASLDSTRLEELGLRGRSLQARIDAVQAGLWRLYAERARAQLPTAEARAVAARAEYERTYAEYLEAHVRTNRLGVEADNASVRAAGLRHEAEEFERRAKELAFRSAPRQS